MGGIPCRLIINAIVRAKAVPTHPADHPEFEAQLRKCYANPEIARAVTDEADGRWMSICTTLAKSSPLSVADLTVLWNGLAEYTTEY